MSIEDSQGGYEDLDKGDLPNEVTSVEGQIYWLLFLFINSRNRTHLSYIFALLI